MKRFLTLSLITLAGMSATACSTYEAKGERIARVCNVISNGDQSFLVDVAHGQGHGLLIYNGGKTLPSAVKIGQPISYQEVDVDAYTFAGGWARMDNPEPVSGDLANHLPTC